MRLRPRRRPSFRARLFAILLLFAVCPSVLLTLAWAGTVTRALPLLGGGAAWERAAQTGERALAVARRGGGGGATGGNGRAPARPLSPGERGALEAHAQELRASLELSRRYTYVAPRLGRVVLAGGVLLVAVTTLVASRVAGHLSRQLSRPLDQLVRWTELVGRGAPLPDEPEPRGAPEFRTMRRRMRGMARELAAGRARALEAERAEAFRETARRVAHELKNPLTPIRFAVEGLRRNATPEQGELVEVLAAETARLEAMARGFAQFGRLPDGPVADVDLGELARWAAATTVPPHLAARVDVAPDVPLVRGRYDALARALTNVLLNAVEATPAGGEVRVRVARADGDDVGPDAVELAVGDTGCGIAPERLAGIWDPYVTHKAHGTGLGLAIARQTVLAHGGRVDAVSAVGRGTEVRFILPAGGAPAGLTHEATGARA